MIYWREDSPSNSSPPPKKNLIIKFKCTACISFSVGATKTYSVLAKNLSNTTATRASQKAQNEKKIQGGGGGGGGGKGHEKYCGVHVWPLLPTHHHFQDLLPQTKYPGEP